MNQQEFEALGEYDPQAQHAWCIQRDAFLQKLWVCPCGAKLSTKGYVWSSRWSDFKQDHRLNTDPTNSGYYCDACANAREAGIDY